MSDFKSKLPDMNELGSMAGKLFKDVKSSVMEIIHDYKQKHEDSADAGVKAEPVKAEPVVAKPAKKESVETKETKTETKETKKEVKAEKE